MPAESQPSRQPEITVVVRSHNDRDLIRAYQTSTADALAAAQVVEKVAGRWYTLRFPYGDLPAVMKLVKDMDLPQRGQSFLADCTLEVRVRATLERDFLERIEKLGTFIG